MVVAGVRRIGLRLRPVKGLFFVVILVLLAQSAAPSGASERLQIEPDGPEVTVSVETTIPADPSSGQIAYVTPTGNLVHALGDGSESRVIGTDVAMNAIGLAPLSWRQPASDSIAYVRTDGALVVASTLEGVEPLILARDAVVPDYVSSEILSWDFSGSFLIYLAETRPGFIESRVVDLTESEEGGPPEIRTIGNPERRTVFAQAFSPLDPIIFQETADKDTGAALTVAIVEPIGGKVFGSPYSVDDITFTPDGRYAFAVSRTNGAVEQMVRIDLRRPTSTELVTDQVRICRPSVSPDARKIVFGSGEDCEEVWTINSDGTDPKRIAKDFDGNAVFDVGQFSWSKDALTITHPACHPSEDGTICGGRYWDISVDGKNVEQRADAGQVLRDFQPLLRPVKFEVEILGPIAYSGRMEVGVDSVADLLENETSEIIDAMGIDSEDNARSYSIQAVHPLESDVMAGTIRVNDGDFDETFQFFGRALTSSLGFVSFRAIWLRSETLPLMTGHLTVTLER